MGCIHPQKNLFHFVIPIEHNFNKKKSCLEHNLDIIGRHNLKIF